MKSKAVAHSMNEAPDEAFRFSIAPLNSRHIAAALFRCYSVCHALMLHQNNSARVNCVMADVAEHNEIRGNVLATRYMSLKVVKLQEARIGARPLVATPMTITARVIVTGKHLALNGFRYMPIVRFSDTIQILQNVFADFQVRSACKMCCNSKSLLGAEFTRSPSKFARLRYICEFFGRHYSIYVGL